MSGGDNVRSSYEDVDERVTQSRLVPILDSLSVDDGADEFERSISRRMTLEQANEFAKDREAAQVGFTHDVLNNARRFSNNTDKIDHMNEAYNANKYISDVLSDENYRIGVLNAEARREVYKLQQRVMSARHRAGYYGFLTRVFLYTMFTSMILAVFLAAWMHGQMAWATFIIFSVIVLIIYAVLLALLFNTNTKRRQFHWNRFYWNPPKQRTEECT